MRRTSLILSQKRPELSGRIRGKVFVPLLEMAFSSVLIVLVDSMPILTSLVLVVAGIPIYIWFTPKRELPELRMAHLSRDAILKRTYAQRKRFLACPSNRFICLIYKLTDTSTAWILGKKSPRRMVAISDRTSRTYRDFTASPSPGPHTFQLKPPCRFGLRSHSLTRGLRIALLATTLAVRFLRRAVMPSTIPPALFQALT